MKDLLKDLELDELRDLQSEIRNKIAELAKESSDFRKDPRLKTIGKIANQSHELSFEVNAPVRVAVSVEEKSFVIEEWSGPSIEEIKLCLNNSEVFKAKLKGIQDNLKMATKLTEKVADEYGVRPHKVYAFAEWSYDWDDDHEK